MFGAFLAERFIKMLIDKRYNFRLIFSYFSVFLLSTFATLANPFGWRVYREVINHFNTPLNTMIAEWVGPADWQKFLVVITALAAAILCAIYKKMDYRFFLLLIFAWFAVSARRNLPIYYLTFFISCLIFLIFKFQNYPQWLR